MKRIFGMLALFSSITLLHAAEDFHRFILETENHVVEITPRCPEGYVTCERVSYKGVSKKTGAALELRGGVTVHTTCADGATPCRFVGYSFRNGKYSYFVGEDPDGVHGTLSVKREGKELLTERGTWR